MKKLSFLDVLNIVWKNVFIIIIFVVIFGIGSFFVGKRTVKPSYSVSGQMLIYHGKLKKYTNLNNDIAMMQTYATVIKDPEIIDVANSALKKNSNYHYNSGQLLNHVWASPVSNSITMTVGVSNVDSKANAVNIVNEVRIAAKKRLDKISGAGNVKILGKVRTNNVDKNSGLTVMKITEIGSILGLLVGLIAAAIHGVSRKKRH